MLSEATGTEDEAERNKLYQQAEDRILEDLPVVPLFYPIQYGLHSDCAMPRTNEGDLQYYRAEYTC